MGVRVGYGKHVSFRFDLAQIFTTVNTRKSSDQRISSGLVINF